MGELREPPHEDPSEVHASERCGAGADDVDRGRGGLLRGGRCVTRGIEETSNVLRFAARRADPMRALAPGALALLVFVACSGASSPSPIACSGDSCVCSGGGICTLDCGTTDHCSPKCDETTNGCDATCADDCAFSCSDSDECSVTCADDCAVECTGPGACAGACGARCNVNCANQGACDALVGNASSVTCSPLAACNVQCYGTCHVHCGAARGCNVTCPTNAPLVHCADGFACGEGC